MNNQSLRTLKILAFVFVFLMLLFSGYEIYLSERFHLVSTTPALNKIITSQISISLNFNKQLSPDKLIVDASPTNISSDQVSGKTLTVKFATIDNKPYTISVLSLYDTGGSSIKNLVLNFTPIYIPYNQLPSSSQKNIINSQQNQNQTTSALGLLPYDGPDYELTLQYNTSDPNASPDIEFTYVPNMMDNTEGTPAEQAAINNAKAWLTDNGISLSSYTLVDSSTGQPL
jgi:hypothetical protein